MKQSTLNPRRGRPPKISRENQDTKAVLIRSGLEQLTENGFSASGLEQILKKVGIPKGSFYYYFASKEAFGLAVIESYAQYFAYKLDTYLLDDTYPALIRLNNFVEASKDSMAHYQFKRGCLVGNLEQEVGLLPLSYRDKLIDILHSWQQRVALCLKTAQISGEIANTADCELLAEFFWIGWEGAVSRAKLVQSDQPLSLYFQHFMAILPR